MNEPDKGRFSVIEFDGGGFGVYSPQEPAFFLEADTIEAALARAQRVIESYLGIFKGVDNPSISFKPVAEPTRIRGKSIGSYELMVA